MQSHSCHHARMPKQLTIRNVPDEVAKRLARLARDRGQSVNTVVLEVLAESVGVEARRVRLERLATWTAEEAAAFDAALAGQRVIDPDPFDASTT
jgi:plasmid stability protein